jgi:putative two-component system response regulator
VRARLDDFEVETARRLAQLAAYRDSDGTGHVDRIGRAAALIAAALAVPEDEVEVIRLAAPLHDIGNIAIPEAILLKEAALTLDELDLIKTHTTVGASLLSGSTSRVLQVAEQIARYHHENWDGSGYAPGVAGAEIPLVGRIVRVADTYDSMVQARAYRAPWRREEAFEFITSQAERRFDPAVVKVFQEVHATGAFEELLEEPAGS